MPYADFGEYIDALALGTSAGLFSKETLLAAMSLPPCPRCARGVTDLASGAAYTVTMKTSEGKSHQVALPPCPATGMASPPRYFTAVPCGCKVSEDWAGAFGAARTHQHEGGLARPLQLPTKAQVELKLNRWQKHLTKLHQLDDKTTDDEWLKGVIHHWKIAVAEEIQRTCPGVHDATTDGGPAAGSVPLYETMTGVLSEKPAFSGQKPKFYMGPDAVAHEAKNVAPLITKTRVGQFDVRCGSIYKVFQTEGEAKLYAAKLMETLNDTGSVPAFNKIGKPKPKLEVETGELLQDKAHEVTFPNHAEARHVLDFTVTNKETTRAVLVDVFRCSDNSANQAALLADVQYNLEEYASGRTNSLTTKTLKFVRTILGIAGARLPETPEVVAAPKQLAPTTPNTAIRRKRTIRRVEE